VTKRAGPDGATDSSGPASATPSGTQATAARAVPRQTRLGSGIRRKRRSKRAAGAAARRRERITAGDADPEIQRLYEEAEEDVGEEDTSQFKVVRGRPIIS
jgi:hypothetical protein